MKEEEVIEDQVELSKAPTEADENPESHTDSDMEEWLRRADVDRKSKKVIHRTAQNWNQKINSDLAVRAATPVGEAKSKKK